MYISARPSDNFKLVSPYLADQFDAPKFDGEGHRKLEKFLLVGALFNKTLNDGKTLSIGDEIFLYVFMSTLNKLGFNISSDYSLQICTLSDNDFLKGDHMADAVLFCNIYHDDLDPDIPAIADEQEPLVFVAKKV